MPVVKIWVTEWPCKAQWGNMAEMMVIVALRGRTWDGSMKAAVQIIALFLHPAELCGPAVPCGSQCSVLSQTVLAWQHRLSHT